MYKKITQNYSNFENYLYVYLNLCLNVFEYAIIIQPGNVKGVWPYPISIYGNEKSVIENKLHTFNQFVYKKMYLSLQIPVGT